MNGAGQGQGPGPEADGLGAQRGGELRGIAAENERVQVGEAAKLPTDRDAVGVQGRCSVKQVSEVPLGGARTQVTPTVNGRQRLAGLAHFVLTGHESHR